MAQDDYYYEIQLSNKQLVFYFMAGATGLILSFLAGVMVGRGVDANAGEVQAARALPVQEEKVVAEEPPKPATPAEDLTYAQRLEADKQDDTLEKVKPATGSAAKFPAAARPAPARPAPGVAPPPLHPATAAPSVPKPAATTPAPKQASPAATSPLAPAGPGPAPKAVAPTAGTFTIQVGAFKDKASADSVVSRLKGKGFAAYVVSPGAAEGLFNVRVGSFTGRADAEHVQGRLRDEEKFKPFIVKN
ncbi:MAG TPA: SPOR domain-containing protein [Vicinamibacteria bacterium]|nr:SPOR domain-containing protein [Vicinamibacteria bacterium]